MNASLCALDPSHKHIEVDLARWYTIDAVGLQYSKNLVSLLSLSGWTPAVFNYAGILSLQWALVPHSRSSAAVGPQGCSVGGMSSQ